MSLVSTETKINILEIYKDETNSLEVGNTVYLIEPFSIILEETYYTSGYQMVSQGQEYILFLNEIQAVDGYKLTKKESISFIPSTNLYSRYYI